MFVIVVRYNKTRSERERRGARRASRRRAPLLCPTNDKTRRVFELASP